MNTLALTTIYLSVLMTAASAFADAEWPECPESCQLWQVCMNAPTPSGSQCVERPMPAEFTLRLPFAKGHKVVCTHSSGSGSHSWSNAFYALDLATPYDQPPATIYASKAGRAYVFVAEDGKLCLNPPGDPHFSEPSSCGQSWGNRVKILHEDGYVSFYAHLDELYVDSGNFIAEGQAIGREGSTGAAGHRHLHFSVNKLPGTTQFQWERNIHLTGDSVPFTVMADFQGQPWEFDASLINCPHANIGSIPAHLQPTFEGVFMDHLQRMRK